MKILLVGAKKENHNYKKIEGFYNAFKNKGDVEWVRNFFECKSDYYDLVFGEINIDEIINKLSDYKKIKIKTHIFWNTIDFNKLKNMSNLITETNFICAYKTDITNKNALIEYQKQYGNSYQTWSYEGINIDDFINNDKTIINNNLKLVYLPCCLSEKEPFENEKIYDLCYFGTIENRPNVKYILDRISEKYKILTNFSDQGSVLTPEECYSFYKKTKATLSEQVQPVVLEYPVRLGESTSTGCKLFLLEKIPIHSNNKLIPEHVSDLNIEDLIKNLENYLENFTVEESEKLYLNFESTYNNASDFLLSL